MASPEACCRLNHVKRIHKMESVLFSDAEHAPPPMLLKWIGQKKFRKKVKFLLQNSE